MILYSPNRLVDIICQQSETVVTIRLSDKSRCFRAVLNRPPLQEKEKQ